MDLYSIAKLPIGILRKTNFCIWHSGRCGSSVLTSMLVQHPKIYCSGELLEPYSNRYEGLENKEKAWSGGQLRITLNMLKGGSRTSGFEMKLWHLKRMGIDVNTAMKFVTSIGYNKHLVLERKNYLRTIVSGHVLKKTSISHIDTQDQSKLNKVHIDAKVIISRLDIFSDFYLQLRKSLDENCLRLSYEDDIQNDPKISFNKVVDYLDLESYDPSIRLGKTNPFTLSEMISNFDEIVNLLKGTQYEWMLNA